MCVLCAKKLCNVTCLLYFPQFSTLKIKVWNACTDDGTVSHFSYILNYCLYMHLLGTQDLFHSKIFFFFFILYWKEKFNIENIEWGQDELNPTHLSNLVCKISAQWDRSAGKHELFPLQKYIILRGKLWQLTSKKDFAVHILVIYMLKWFRIRCYQVSR